MLKLIIYEDNKIIDELDLTKLSVPAYNIFIRKIHEAYKGAQKYQRYLNDMFKKFKKD